MPLSYSKVRCCGVCRFSCASASCCCSGVDSSQSMPVYVASLAQALQRVVQINDSETLQVASCLTCFRGTCTPTISIADYVNRIAKYSKCSPVCFIMAWSYLKRICGQEHTELAVTSLTVHRLVICSVLLAVKMTDDKYYNNAFFAKIGGIDVSELNTMELEMLKLLDFRTHVPTSEIRWLLLRLKALQGPGPITSVLCRKRLTRSVDDLPDPKQRELHSAVSQLKSVNFAENLQTSHSRSAALKAASCKLLLSTIKAQDTSDKMARSPSNGFCLPRLPNQPCSLQDNESTRFPVDVGVVKVSA